MIRTASRSGLAAGAALLCIRGGLTLDLGIGRRVRPLGPIARDIAASPETVFDVIAGPYLGKTPRAMADKLRVLERGSDMVLAEHFTDLGHGLIATTLETVRFERPNRVSFHLVRGPVPHVVETYELTPDGEGTSFVYSGELGVDLWALGSWYGDLVAKSWNATVAAAIEEIAPEAERLAGRTRAGSSADA